jgi:hypothetical protein
MLQDDFGQKARGQWPLRDSVIVKDHSLRRSPMAQTFRQEAREVLIEAQFLQEMAKDSVVQAVVEGRKIEFPRLTEACGERLARSRVERGVAFLPLLIKPGSSPTGVEVAKDLTSVALPYLGIEALSNDIDNRLVDDLVLDGQYRDRPQHPRGFCKK